jgi:ABC-type dipeptide/oligopeptide/nickel transport system ATPase component
VTGGITSVTGIVDAPASELALGEHSLDVREAVAHHDRHYIHEQPGASDQTLLKVDRLTVRFDGRQAGSGTTAVEDVSLVVNPGDRVGIVGETGSGKSVLVRAILNILPENAEVLSGSVVVGGHSLFDLDADTMRKLRGTTIAPILPNPKAQLNPLVRIGKIFAGVLRAHDEDLDGDAIAIRSRAALEQVGISDAERRLRQYPHELSGGMAQRVCIALSLLHSPKLLIADEPTAGLDVTVQRQVLDVLTELSSAKQTAQLIVTRDLAIVAHYCTWMGVMHRGHLVEFGRTLDVFDNPHHVHTRELMRAVRIDDERGVLDV